MKRPSVIGRKRGIFHLESFFDLFLILFQKHLNITIIIYMYPHLVTGWGGGAFPSRNVSGLRSSWNSFPASLAVPTHNTLFGG